MHVEEIEEGLFNRFKTRVLVHKEDFKKRKECALKYITRDTIHSYLYKYVERLKENNKILENEKKNLKKNILKSIWVINEKIKSLN